MTTAELKQNIDGMTLEERIFATAYLRHLARVNDPLHRTKLGERMRRMDKGNKISLEQTERLHQGD